MPHPIVMLERLNEFLDKKLSSLGRDGVSAVEAASWLVEAGLLDRAKQPIKKLRALLRAGKVKGAYQFPNKRWVIVNRSRLPDGIQRVVPLPEAAQSLGLSHRTLKEHARSGRLKPLNFGSAGPFFLEEELRRFHRENIDRSFRMLFPGEEKELGPVDLDRFRRQLYYLRSDIRLIAERIEELIKLLD